MNTLNKIQQVVSDRIRPALQGHGGDMTITSFSNGILKFKFTGMCSNCSFSMDYNRGTSEKRNSF